MVQVELIGPTGGGKSTLAGRILEACRAEGVTAVAADELLLRKARLGWLPGELLHTVGLDLLAVFACLATWHRNSDFYRFAVRVLRELPGSVPYFEKANLFRNVIKKVGTFEALRAWTPEDLLVVVDEGTLQAVHNLFVHLATELREEWVRAFARIVPLPEVAVYVSANETTLIRRTLARGHRRIRDLSPETVASFVRRAEAAFDLLVEELVAERGMVRSDPSGRVLVAPNRQERPAVSRAVELLCRIRHAGAARWSLEVQP
jgi:hypothetical protein